MRIHIAIVGGLAIFAAGVIWADQLEMQNGDRISGKVLSMTADSVILQSDSLGKMTVVRSNIAKINLGNSGGVAVSPIVPHPTNHSLVVASRATNVSPNVAETLRAMGADTNIIEQVRKQFLSGAGPEANQKFDDLLSGLFDGKFDLTKLRAEARTAADQIRELKRSGGDAGEPLDSYLAVLDKFLKESAHSTPSVPVAPPATNSSPGIIIIR